MDVHWQKTKGSPVFVGVDDPKSKWTNKQIKSVINICMDNDIKIPNRFLVAV